MIYFGINQQTNKIQEVIIINSYDEEEFDENYTLKTNDYEVILRAPFGSGSVVNYLDNFEFDYSEDKFINHEDNAIKFVFAWE